MPGQIIHKFGRNPAVGTSFAPVSFGGIYQTPQVSGATTLRVKAGGNADDTAAGDGAREITLQGIDETGALATETLATAGESASSATTTTFIRLFRVHVSASGSYATASSGSHTASITIENGGGGTDWATIDATGFARAQSEIGVYTIPSGMTGHIFQAEGFTDSTKTTNALFFQRQNILETAAPFTAMRLLFEEFGEGGAFTFRPIRPIQIQGPTDIGFLAKVDAGTAQVDVDFEIELTPS